MVIRGENDLGKRKMEKKSRDERKGMANYFK